MKEWTVTYRIEIWGESPEDAAQGALETLRDPTSSALIFEVVEFEKANARLHVVDLWIKPPPESSA